jgi:arylsulfatase
MIEAHAPNPGCDRNRLRAPGPAVGNAQQAKQPNILVIWGDDIGWQNVSAYGMGTMGYTTPNIDRIGMEGIRFTDHYAQPSCTAGRARSSPASIRSARA